MRGARLPALLVATISTLHLRAEAAPPDLGSHEWREIVPRNAPPPPRSDAGMVHDRARGRVILFGGRASGADFDDTWAFDLQTLTWTELAPAPAVRPTARFSMVAGLDAPRDRMIVSTGQSGSIFLSDAWALDLTTDTWTELTPAGGPPADRYGSAGGIFSPDGQAGAALYFSHGFNAGRFDDTWALDLATDTWQEASPPGTPPVARCLHASTMLADDTMLLFGGCSSTAGCPLDDLWLFDRSDDSWIELTPASGPSARTYPGLVALGTSDSALLFGGGGSTNLQDLWLFDRALGTWQELTPPGPPPAPRRGHSMVWLDGAGCDSLLVFGGAGNSGALADLHLLAPAGAATVDPRVTAVRAGADVELSWGHDPANLDYELWRSEAADLDPLDPTTMLLTEPIQIVGPDASSTDTTTVAGITYYYRVGAVGCPR